jgi:predicted enzyme related to lactoylglutathione lyase
MEINLIVLKTPRPDDLASFYELLGIKFERHQHGKGPIHYAAELGRVVFEIYPLPKGILHVADTLRLGFTVANLHETIQRIRDQGGPIIKEPHQTEWGQISIIEDLDGRKIELKETARP